MQWVIKSRRSIKVIANPSFEKQITNHKKINICSKGTIFWTYPRHRGLSELRVAFTYRCLNKVLLIKVKHNFQKYVISLMT